MKRYYIKFAILLMGLGLAVGCDKEFTDSSSGPSDKVTISLSLNKSPQSSEDESALPSESAITSAYVYIFNLSGHLENTGKTTVNLKEGSPISEGLLNRSWEVYPGQKDIYVVLNPPEKVKDKNGNDVEFSKEPSLSKSLLESLRTISDNLDTDFYTTNNNGMLMVGHSQVDITTDTHTETIEVGRRYSKVEVNVRKETALSGTDVKIKKVTLKNYSTQTMFAGLGDDWTESATSTTGYSETMTTEVKAIGDKESVGGEYTSLGFVRYMMPRPASVSKTKGIPVVEIVAEIGENNTKTYNIYFTKDYTNAAGDEPYDIFANFIYEVNITLLRGEVDVDLEIKGWKDYNIDSPINGGAYIVASELALDEKVETQEIEFTVKPIPESGTVTVDWSGINGPIKHSGTPAGGSKTTVGVDPTTGKGVIKVEWEGYPGSQEPFEGSIIIKSDKLTKSVGVMHGVYIPDPIFRDYLRTNGFIECKNDYGLSKIKDDGTNKKTINLSSGYTNVTDLSGIENFPEITKLNISGTKVAYMRLSDNKKLQALDCSSVTTLKTLDVTGLPDLQRLTCNGCNFSATGTIDVSGNPVLSYFKCSSSKLTSLNLTANPLLDTLVCGSNTIATQF